VSEMRERLRECSDLLVFMMTTDSHAFFNSDLNIFKLLEASRTLLADSKCLMIS